MWGTTARLGSAFNGDDSRSALAGASDQKPPRMMSTFPNEVVTCQWIFGSNGRLFIKYERSHSQATFGGRSHRGPLSGFHSAARHDHHRPDAAGGRRAHAGHICRRGRPGIGPQLDAGSLGIKPYKLVSRVRNSLTFSGRGIPSGGVAPPSHIPDMLGRRALPAGRLAALGATTNFRDATLAFLAT
jgi:hypothetical protein